MDSRLRGNDRYGKVIKNNGMKKLINIIKEYLPDILFITGVYIFSYNILRPVVSFFEIDLDPDYTNEKVLGIVLIAVGIDIAVRRYISYKNKQKNK